MFASDAEILAVLTQYNPWWRGARVPDLPQWQRRAYREILGWMISPPAPRALLVSGARQIGKTTLMLQVIEALVQQGVPPERILYVTFDHPLLKLVGIDLVLELWRAMRPPSEGIDYLFLDEVQALRDWQTWLKLQVDFRKNVRIAVTGSATPLVTEGQESGVGRWHTLRLATLSFFEFLHLKGIDVPAIPEIVSLTELYDWPAARMAAVAANAEPLASHFNEYLLRGGFPQSALSESVTGAQRLLREDIVDKVLKRDMTALFGVRHVLELEQVFLYLCLHGGGVLDVQALCANLELKKPTVNSFINLLEATHLIYKLPPHGYGKEILRGRFKVHLADPSIAPAVMLKGRSLLEDDTALGVAVETAVIKHLVSSYGPRGAGFSYWKGTKDREVDTIVEFEGRLLPFEVKYRTQRTGAGDLPGLIEFCRARKVDRAYALTRSLKDFSVLTVPQPDLFRSPIRVLKVPAALACYWLGSTELAA